jgi:predicted acyl esterase
MRSLLRSLTLVCVIASAALAQQPAPDSNFTYTRAMVTMRDGVKLNTVFFVPKKQNGPLPVLFVRTPYGVPAETFPLSRAYAELVADGYIFAFQDIRGKYDSEGQFVMQRAPRPIDAGGSKAVDESTDAYDSIDWAQGYSA